MRALIYNFQAFTIEKNKKTIICKKLQLLRKNGTNLMSSHISVFPLNYFNSCAQLKEKYEALLADKEKELNLVKTW